MIILNSLKSFYSILFYDTALHLTKKSKKMFTKLKNYKILKNKKKNPLSF